MLLRKSSRISRSEGRLAGAVVSTASAILRRNLVIVANHKQAALKRRSIIRVFQELFSQHPGARRSEPEVLRKLLWRARFPSYRREVFEVVALKELILKGEGAA
jgi:hypothetical protein